MSQTVLLVGATGMLGGRIAHHLLEQPETHVRLLVRDPGNPEKSETLQSLVKRGAELVEGDLTNATSLDRATQGVDVIVSAVQGGHDVIVEGQVALAESGRRNGVRRILPSDFGLDLFKATPGEHAAFNWRASADEKIATLGMEHIHVLQGGFMDMFGPGSPLVDYEKGVISFWGDGERPIEVTTVDDTARMTAHVALDRSLTSGKFAFAGDHVSFQQVADTAEKITGIRFERRSQGTEAELRTALDNAAVSNPMEAIMLAYQLYMLNGQTALTSLQNNRYPNVKLQGFESFLRGRFSQKNS